MGILLVLLPSLDEGKKMRVHDYGRATQRFRYLAEGKSGLRKRRPEGFGLFRETLASSRAASSSLPSLASPHVEPGGYDVTRLFHPQL
jgi:hypothetical protein